MVYYTVKLIYYECIVYIVFYKILGTTIAVDLLYFGRPISNHFYPVVLTLAVLFWLLGKNILSMKISKVISIMFIGLNSILILYTLHICVWYIGQWLFRLSGLVLVYLVLSCRNN